MELTPEQRRQLQLIEEMPLTRELEISQEEWDSKAPDEKERIQGYNFYWDILYNFLLL